MRTTKRLMGLVMTVVAGALFFSTLATAATIEIKAKDGIGSYLTDDKGMALYLFKKDTPGKSACLAATGCLEKWPIYYVDRAEPSGGVSPGAFATITRDDGKKQTTFKGRPLYYFFNDKEPGDTNGQGVNNSWYLAVP
jgi:predicted lipoprotein with Yx(FWY)xxD motif